MHLCIWSVYMYVCMYICMYVCMYVKIFHLHLHSNTLIYTNKHTRISITRKEPFLCSYALLKIFHLHLHSDTLIYQKTYTYSPFPGDETRNGHWNIKRNPRWWKLKSFFKWAVWKETCDDHQGFRCVFWWPFRVSSSRQRIVSREKNHFCIPIHFWKVCTSSWIVIPLHIHTRNRTTQKWLFLKKTKMTISQKWLFLCSYAL